MTIPQYRLTARAEYRYASEIPVIDILGDEPITSHAGLYDGSSGGGSVTHDATGCEIIVGVSTGGSDLGLVRSHARPRAGSLGTRTTRVVSRVVGLVTDQVKEWGIGDDDDAFLFRVDGETLSVVRRTNVSGAAVETTVARAQWNVDSSTVVDVEKTHVWEIREAAPSGDVDFAVDGIVMHRVSVDGSIQGPATARSRLPLLLRCANDAVTSGGGSLRVAGASISVTSEPSATSQWAVQDRDSAVSSSSTSMVMVRPKATLTGVANRGETRLTSLSVYAAAETILDLVRGASPASAPTSHAATSRSESSAAPGELTGGVVERSWTLSGSATIELDDVCRVLADGTADTLCITARSISGTHAVNVALSWEEIP